MLLRGDSYRLEDIAGDGVDMKTDRWPRVVWVGHDSSHPWRLLHRNGSYVREDGRVRNFSTEQVARTYRRRMEAP